MAVDVKASNMKADLLKIAAENGIKVDESMTKAQIIAAINAQDSAEPTESAATTGADKSAQQTAAEGAVAAETSGATTDTAEGKSTAQSGTAGAPQTPASESAQQSPQDGEGTAETSGASKDTAEEESATQSATEGENDEYDMFAYIGPTLPHGQLKENAIFRGKIKDVLNYLSDVLEDYPQVEKLIVPTHKLAKYSAKAKTPGNVVHKYYNDIVSTMRGNKEV